MNKNKKKKGFTLIELIAVIAILGILAAVIVPRVGNFTGQANTARNKSDAATILNAIEVYNVQVDESKKLGSASTTTNNQDPTVTVIKAGTNLTVDTTKKGDLDATIAKLPTNSELLSKKISDLQSLVSATN